MKEKIRKIRKLFKIFPKLFEIQKNRLKLEQGAFQQSASKNNLIVVCPDTSPRGLGVEGEDDNWDFGTGAGFYVDATEDKWKQYRMYSYGKLYIFMVK